MWLGYKRRTSFTDKVFLRLKFWFKWAHWREKPLDAGTVLPTLCILSEPQVAVDAPAHPPACTYGGLRVRILTHQDIAGGTFHPNNICIMLILHICIFKYTNNIYSLYIIEVYSVCDICTIYIYKHYAIYMMYSSKMQSTMPLLYSVIFMIMQIMWYIYLWFALYVMLRTHDRYVQRIWYAPIVYSIYEIFTGSGGWVG